LTGEEKGGEGFIYITGEKVLPLWLFNILGKKKKKVAGNSWGRGGRVCRKVKKKGGVARSHWFAAHLKLSILYIGQFCLSAKREEEGCARRGQKEEVPPCDVVKGGGGKGKQDLRTSWWGATLVTSSVVKEGELAYPKQGEFC